VCGSAFPCKAPRKYGRKQEPRGDQAARAVAQEGLTFTQAGDQLGITPEAVSHAWQRLFPEQDPPQKYRRKRESRGDQAARAAAKEGLTFTEAGAQLGVSPQAVQQAWQRLFPGQDPPRKRRSARISEMLRVGRSISEVADEVGLSEEHVRSVAQRSGVEIPSKGLLRAMKFQEKFDQAMAAIAAGASISKAARDHGMSHGSLSRAMARRRLTNQEPPPGDEPRSARGARRPYTAADVVIEERDGIVCVYGFADGEDAPIREVFRRVELPQRAGEHRATESNLFNARCRIAAKINRRNRKRTSGAIPFAT